MMVVMLEEFVEGFLFVTQISSIIAVSPNAISNEYSMKSTAIPPRSSPGVTLIAVNEMEKYVYIDIF